MDDIKVFTTKEVAEILQTDSTRVTALVRSGKLIATKGLREYRFTEDAIKAYLTGNTTAEASKKRAKQTQVPFLEERRKLRKELEEKGEWIKVRR